MTKVLSGLIGIGRGSMVMLGNTIFAFGDAAAIEEKLKGWGTVIRSRTTANGAYIL